MHHGLLVAAERVPGRLQRFAIANPEHAPYGARAREALTALGLWDAIQPKLVFGENIAQTAQFATSGSTQGGIIALSLAKAPAVASLGSFALLPEQLHQPLAQRMVLLKDAPADWSEFVALKEYNYTLKTPDGVTMAFPDNDKEGYSTPGQLEDYVVAPGKTRITLPFGTFASNNGFLLDHGTYRCPQTNQPGQSPIFGGHNTDLPLTLLFYRGIKETSITEEYAYATHDELDTDETTVIGVLSLELDGSYGLVAQNFGSSLLFSDLQSLDIRAVLPASALHTLRLWKNARVRFFHPNGAVVMVLRSVEFQVSSRMDGGWLEARVRGVVE